MLSAISRYCLKKRTQPRYVGEAFPLSSRRIFERSPPNQATILAFGLPQAQKVDTIPPRFGHRSHLLPAAEGGLTTAILDKALLGNVGASIAGERQKNVTECTHTYCFAPR